MVVTVRELDLSKADGYRLTNFDLLRRALKRDKKYRRDLLYRGFDGKHIPKLLKIGQDSLGKYLSCTSEEEIKTEFPVAGFDCDPFQYAFENEDGSKREIPAIAVFDSRHIHQVTYGMYQFKDPKKKLEALVAVYRLKLDE